MFSNFRQAMDAECIIYIFTYYQTSYEIIKVFAAQTFFDNYTSLS